MRHTPGAVLRVDVLDPPAYTPPYDHAICSALARAGASVRLVTGPFDYGSVPEPEDYEVVHGFYASVPGPAGSRRRRAGRLLRHPLDMARYARTARPDVVHLQWSAVEALDARLLPFRAPLVLTAHDALARPLGRFRRAGHAALLRRADAVVVHSRAGRARLLAEVPGLDPARVRMIRHGSLEHLTRPRERRPLPFPLSPARGPVALCFGLMRPYKGIDVLLEAWRGVGGAELWLVGLPKMDVEALRAAAPPSVRWLCRFVPDEEVPAIFETADLVVLPYREIDQSGVAFTALAFGKPMLLTDVGGFPEIAEGGAAALVPPGDPAALRAELQRLLHDPRQLAALAAGARELASGEYAWDSVAAATLGLYRELRAAAAGP